LVLVVLENYIASFLIASIQIKTDRAMLLAIGCVWIASHIVLFFRVRKRLLNAANWLRNPEIRMMRPSSTLEGKKS